MLYLIKLNIILAILCLLFQVLMHRDTFFGIRRAMLIGIYAVALLLPLCNVQALLDGRAVAQGLAADYATYVLPTLEVTASRVASMGLAGQQAAQGSGPWASYILPVWILLALPALWLSGKMAWQIGTIVYLRYTCAHVKLLGQRVYLYPEPCSPFSFGPWIFLHREGIHDNAELREVIVHEQTHVRQWHTLDVLLSQFFCIAFWWNPATWVLRREVRINLEFLADAAVVGRDTDKRTYQYHLLGLASQLNVATLTNNFNVLPLKRRIMMMNAKRTRHIGMLKYILFVPAAAAIVLLSNIDAMARTIAAEVKPLVGSANTQLVQKAPVPAVAVEQRQPESRIEQKAKPVMDSANTGKRQDGEPRTIKELKEAILVVDGNIVTDEEFHKLAMEDAFESVTLLEDKAATDLWGARGANGVIVAKTKANEKEAEAVADTSAIYEKVEEMPEYPGGMEAMYRFLQGHVKYPAIAQEIGAQGKVFVQFVVKADGWITDVQTPKLLSADSLREITIIAYKKGMTEEEKKAVDAQNEAHESLKKEAVRVIKWMPRWKPGKKDGKPVNVSFNLPITFRLQ